MARPVATEASGQCPPRARPITAVRATSCSISRAACRRIQFARPSSDAGDRAPGGKARERNVPPPALRRRGGQSAPWLGPESVCPNFVSGRDGERAHRCTQVAPAANVFAPATVLTARLYTPQGHLLSRALSKTHCRTPSCACTACLSPTKASVVNWKAGLWVGEGGAACPIHRNFRRDPGHKDALLSEIGTPALRGCLQCMAAVFLIEANYICSPVLNFRLYVENAKGEEGGGYFSL